MSVRRATAPGLLGVAILVGATQAEDLLQPGAYEVEVRLEVPNVHNWAAGRTATICVPNADTAGAPLPVLSEKNPLAECPARNIQRDGATLSFDILCEGRDAARARAIYTLMPRAFDGRIAMVMGGKNMTMTEVQSARRVGSCDLPRRPTDRRPGN